MHEAIKGDGHRDSPGARWHGARRYDRGCPELRWPDARQQRWRLAQCVRGLERRAWAYYRQDRFELALQDCGRAIELDPSSHACHRVLGISYLMLGENGRSIEPLDQAIALDPANGYYYHSRAAAYANLGDWERAIADYDRSIELGVVEADNFYDRGRARTEIGDRREAIADFTEVIRLEPDNALAFMARAGQWNAIGAFDKAVEDAARAIKLAPADTWGWWQRGIAEMGLGRHAEAAATLAQYARMEPGDLDGVILAFLAYRRANGDDVSRLRASTQGLDLNQWPGEAVRYLFGESDVETVREQGVIAGSECDAMFYIGEALIAEGEGSKARLHMERAEQICARRPALRALATAELGRLEP